MKLWAIGRDSYGDRASAPLTVEDAMDAVVNDGAGPIHLHERTEGELWREVKVIMPLPKSGKK